jgi:hypothetical protein
MSRRSNSWFQSAHALLDAARREASSLEHDRTPSRPFARTAYVYLHPRAHETSWPSVRLMSGSTGNDRETADPGRVGPYGGRQAAALAPFVGQWVALDTPTHVLVAADDPHEVLCLAQTPQSTGELRNAACPRGGLAGRPDGILKASRKLDACARILPGNS